MGITICNHCKEAVATNAALCPHCGAPGPEEEITLQGAWSQFKKLNSTRTNFPFFLGAVVGVLAVLGLHLLLTSPGTKLDWFTVSWQVFLGALAGCFVGGMMRPRA